MGSDLQFNYSVLGDSDNLASRRVIEANGGVLEDVRGVKKRYWVPTGS